MANNSETTPMMRQYYAIKEEVPGTLLLFRLGDFYELFFEDAVIASKELQITLTARQKERGTGIPMCGVPYHAAESYVARLLRAGHKVAICDQAAPARKGVKLVPRKITRVITPGTVTDLDLLRSGENNYLMAVVERDDCLGSAFLDVSTGEFRVRQSDAIQGRDRLLLDLEHLRPREVVFPRSAEEKLPRLDGCVLSPLDDWLFDDAAIRLLCEHFGLANLEGLGLADKPAAAGAAGALIYYARHTQKADLAHITSLNIEEEADYMVLDSSSIRNLELIESSNGGSKSETLLAVIDHTATGMGGRLLRNWLLRPSIDRLEINARQDAVEEFIGAQTLHEEFREALGGICDIERLLSKVTIGTTTPRELMSLREAFSRLPTLHDLMSRLGATRFAELREQLDVLEDLHGLLAVSITDEPPVTLNAGGVIREGYDEGLDELRGISRNSKTYLAGLEQREKVKTGIGSLKIRYNRVFGYYIEISKSNLHRVPEDYVRKQTLVGHERFVTEELKEYEETILTAEERLLSLEKEIFQRLRQHLSSEAARIKVSATVIAQIDVVSSLALQARKFAYSKPELTLTDSLLVRNGRHPVLEVLAEEHRAERFIPNDLFMDEGDSRIQLVTGPNMGGKSTFLRQNALIVILAQIGSFVPAQFARLPIVDRVFTRIGASDNLARGRSTFMVEMIETAIILNSATSRSLIILDEVGRGTATFDGLSIAWAVVEYIQEQIHAKTLFATHYHELTELADLLPGIRNFHLTVKEAENRIIFLRKVAEGPADRSYGIEVARLAGIPVSVIERSREILKKHEETEHELSDNLTVRAGGPKPSSINQLALFSQGEEELLGRLRELDLDHVTPIEALKILAGLKEKADKT